MWATVTVTASLDKTVGNRQMGHRAKLATVGKRGVGRESGTRGEASLARKARRAGEKRQDRVKGKVMAMWEAKAVWSHREEQEKKLRGLGGVGLKGWVLQCKGWKRSDCRHSIQWPMQCLIAWMEFVGRVVYQSYEHSDYMVSIWKGGARKKLMAAAAAVTPEQWKKAEEAKCLRCFTQTGSYLGTWYVNNEQIVSFSAQTSRDTSLPWNEQKQLDWWQGDTWSGLPTHCVHKRGGEPDL